MNEVYQFWSLVVLIGGGFAWILTWLKQIDKSVSELDKRVTVMEARIGFIERLLEMMGNIPKFPNNKERTDP